MTDRTSPPDPFRVELGRMLDGRDARLPFEAAVDRFPADAINRRAPNVAVTPWHVLEHIRIGQLDILRYIRDRDYLEPNWPDEYWPAHDAVASAEDFARTIAQIVADQAALRAIVDDPANDLLAAIPGTPGHTIAREIRIVAEHNAYHTGEFAILRQVMGTWPPDRVA